MSHDAHAGGAHNPFKQYFLVFGILTFVTAFEMLPLFEIVKFPAVLLLALSLGKFVAVVMFFMHLWGDKPINQRLFFIPLVMMTLSVMVLMTLQSSWTLAYQETARGRDSDEVAARYQGKWQGECSAWVKSPFTGNLYCSSPAVGFSTQAAYDALKPSGAPDPAFDGFDTKSPDDKKAVLMAAGEKVYGGNCLACHGPEGKGTTGVFPPLAADPVANGGDVAVHLKTVLNGMSGVAIGGVSYATAMPPWAQLTDQQIASVVTFERNSWGNAGGVVEPAQVKDARGK